MRPLLDRFRAESRSDEMARCNGCQCRMHYTQLDWDGFCDECKGEWCDEDVEAMSDS